MTRNTLLLLLLTISLVMAPPAAGAEEAPTTAETPTAEAPPPEPEPKKPEPPKQSPIEAAVKALRAEYDAYLKNSGSTRVRDTSDYFQQNPAADLAQEQVIEALGKSMRGDPRTEAYVKWQLLSGITGKIDDQHAKAALQAYRRAPKVQPKPGYNRRSIDEIVRRLPRGNTTKEDAEKLNNEFQKHLDGFDAQNAMIITYRDAFFLRLPPSSDTYKAGLEDVYERFEAGANYSALMNAIVDGYRGWSLGGASQSEVQEIARLADRMRSSKVSDRLASIDYHNKDKRLNPKIEKREFKSDKLDQIVDIAKTTRSTGGGLDFK